MAINGNPPDIPDTTPHKWRFVRIGGFDHVLINSGEDISSIPHLDQKLWAALACPTQGLEFDPATLAHMDKDKDGRIRASEVIEALNWTLSLIRNPDDLTRSNTQLPLSAINEESPEAKDILSCAREILINTGKGQADTITPADVADKVKIFANTRFNGDGIIPAMASEDPAVQQVIEDIMDCLGSEPDRSGLPGITKEKADQFFTEASQYSEWWRRAEGENADILPFGDETEIAAGYFEAVRPKVDDFFTRCRLAAFDTTAALYMNPAKEQYEAVSKMPLSSKTDEIAAFPLAAVRARADLLLRGAVNPAWEKALSDFRDKVVIPLLKEDKDALNLEEWRIIKDRFFHYEAWKADKSQSPVEKLGLQRIREILDSQSEPLIAELLEKDKALEATASSFDSLDRLIHYYCRLHILLNNFISFRDFYTPEKKAVFQAGTLYLDGRSCDLCIRVKDPAAHSVLAQMGGVYLAYCECTRKDSPERIMIAAAFTQGDSDNLLVGRNGIFYDRKNQDWDATIVKIIDHPISIRQAFWSPYKRVSRMIRTQIEKFAAERDKAVDKNAAAAATAAGQKPEPGKTPERKAFDVGKFAGIFAAIGLAVGAIGTAIASVMTGLMGLHWWQVPLALIGLMLLISGPSILMAALRLHRRNLSPILDACGWAVNSRARINIAFGNTLTKTAVLPKGSTRSLQDPYAEKKSPLRLFILVLLLMLALAGLFVLKTG